MSTVAIEQAKQTLQHAMEDAAEIITQLGGTPPPSPHDGDSEVMLTAANKADSILCESRSEGGDERQKAWEDSRTTGGKQAEDVLNDLQASRDRFKALVDET
ncbi:MAG TPA: hypothetical protein VLC46_16325 [Thermoanaerobaculia bacterium]|jgi:vacuolar-type H+-ATPase subunit H|nr:hypothetical protein [Thermoanaerobaculia bacterium]